MAMRIVFSFFGIVVSAAFLAVGLLMAFWPATYLRWARWSVENCAPWLVRGWDVNHSQYRWGFRMVGTAAVLCIWIPWFQ
jgi:hypothetical protein